jgi:hypothetical protein
MNEFAANPEIHEGSFMFAAVPQHAAPSKMSSADISSANTFGSSHDLGNTDRDRLSLRHGNHDVRVQSLTPT